MISLNGKRRGILKFNEKIKLLRSEKGLTQEELSKRLRVSNRSYISWEKGESVPRDLRVYLELTKVFSVSLDYLLLGISNDDDMERAIQAKESVTKGLDAVSDLYFVFKANNLSMKERLFLEEKVEKMYLNIKLINYKLEKEGEF